MWADELLNILSHIKDHKQIKEILMISRTTLTSYFDPRVWKSLILAKYPSMAFLYRDLSLKEIDWYVEAELLYYISQLVHTEDFRYVIFPNYCFDITNQTMLDEFEKRVASVMRNWYPISSLQPPSSFQFADSWFLYDTDKLEWILRYDSTGYLSYSNGASMDRAYLDLHKPTRNPHFVRSYTVIPSYLFLYRLILMFDKLKIYGSGDLWYCTFVHLETGSYVKFHDSNAGFRFSTTRLGLEKPLFQAHLLQLLNLLCMPFFPNKKLRNLHLNQIGFRKRLRCTRKLSIPVFRDMILSRCDTKSDAFKAYSNAVDDDNKYFKRIPLPFLVSCEFYCSKHFFSPQDEYDNPIKVRYYHIKRIISSQWHLTDRTALQLRPVVYSNLSSHWYSSTHHSISLSEICLCLNDLRYRLIYKEEIPTEIIPSSLFLYRLLCVFSSSTDFVRTDDCIWKITLSHDMTARLICFCDKNGQIEISVMYETTELQYPQNGALINQLYRGSHYLELFFTDVVLLLDYLIGDTVAHPNGTAYAGYVA